MEEMIADWWTSKLLIKNKRNEFKHAFLQKYDTGLQEHTTRGRWIISVDYNPDDFLWSILDEIGIVSESTMFTANGIFPAKIKMRIGRDGVMVSDGYGSQWVELGA